MSMIEPPVARQFDPIDLGDGRTARRISDFGPGIHTAVAPSYSPGTAQADGTYCCLTSPTGSLVPAPRLTGRITAPTDLFIGTDMVADQYRIGGIFANAPVYSIEPGNLNTTGEDEVHTELLVGFERWTDITLHLSVWRYTRNKRVPAWELIWERSIGADYADNVRPRAAFFGSQRSNSGSVDPTVSGPQVVSWVYSGNARFFPPDTAATTTTSAALPGDQVGDPQPMLSPTYLVTHQGRSVVFPLYVTGDGEDQVYISSECAYWTEVNDSTTLDPNLTNIYFNILGGYETSAGYGVFLPMTADQLFLVKIRGGALMVYGDLSSPSEVRTLPMVQSTGLALCNGVVTPLGAAYPVDTSGVWLWQGGDTSMHLTRHLDPDFWRPPAQGPAYTERADQTAYEYGYGNTQAALWNEYVLWPNNWLWDTDEGGWWRIFPADHDTIPTFHRWQTDDRGRFAWASPDGFTSTANPILYEFSRLKGATYYSWRGHPQNHSITADTEVTELVICAQGSGRVRVTIETDTDRHEPASVIVEVSDTNRPRPVRVSTKAVGASFTFRIESIGADHDESLGAWDPSATIEAPVVHWVDYITRGHNQFPNAG
jgi:hypothetical protein